MFQVIAITSPTQSLPFTTNRIPRPSFAVRCRVAIPNESTGCLISTQNSTPASLYEILSVKQNASLADIKSAYRRLAKIYHPDANSPEFDCSDFIQINYAYETLSDPKSRAIYDGSIGLVGRRNVARSAASTTSFGCYASGSSIGRRPGFYPTRRWESDQCW